jgi:hypothetical protein
MFSNCRKTKIIEIQQNVYFSNVAYSILRRVGARYFFISLLPKKAKTKTKNGGDGRPNSILKEKTFLKTRTYYL